MNRWLECQQELTDGFEISIFKGSKMTSKVRLFSNVAKEDFHAGTVAGKYRFTLTPGPVQDEDSPESTFTGVVDGDYTGSVIRLDADTGLPLLNTFERTIVFTVPLEPNVQIDVPQDISVEVTSE